MLEDARSLHVNCNIWFDQHPMAGLLTMNLHPNRHHRFLCPHSFLVIQGCLPSLDFGLFSTWWFGFRLGWRINLGKTPSPLAGSRLSCHLNPVPNHQVERSKIQRQGIIYRSTKFTWPLKPYRSARRQPLIGSSLLHESMCGGSQAILR